MISIHPLQQVNCEPNKIVSPLIKVKARTIGKFSERAQMPRRFNQHYSFHMMVRLTTFNTSSITSR